MDFEQLINARQSDRKYDTQPIDRALLVRCLEAARIAPSACNSQPWKFVVVDDPKLLAGMKEAAAGMGMNKWVTDVPVIVAVVLEKMNLTARIGSVIKDKEYSLLDVGIAVEHFCLQATELGLGTCIIGSQTQGSVAHQRRLPRLRTPEKGTQATGRNEQLEQVLRTEKTGRTREVSAEVQKDSECTSASDSDEAS